MKITDLKIRVVAPEDFTFQWREDIPPIQNTMTVFEIVTDDGITGVATTWLPAGPNEIAESAAHFFRPMLIGEDPLDRERLWQSMMAFDRYTILPKAASAIDIALWDIAGKAAGEPVYRLLGAYRDKIGAYATTQAYETTQGYVDLALECQRIGLHGVKIHPPSVPDRDIEICQAVREAVGPGYTLMLDPTSAYDWYDAIRVGRAIEQLDFFWYEDPIHDDDLAGFKRLTETLDIPVLMGESQFRGVRNYANLFAQGTADAVRVVGDVMGGITGMRKVAALAEVHGRNMEPHSYGSTIVQAAHLHIMLSIRNCTFFEMPFPKGPLDFGMKDVIEADSEGFVHAPTAPGLGYEVDWDLIDNETVAEF